MDREFTAKVIRSISVVVAETGAREWPSPLLTEPRVYGKG